MILYRTLWKHWRRATLHNVDVQSFDLRNVMDWNIFACFSYSISYQQRWKSQLVKYVDCKNDHITIYSPEKGLRVTLSSSMIKMEHHPCGMEKRLSYQLVYCWVQGQHLLWGARNANQLCPVEALYKWTEIAHIFLHIALQARHQLHMCVLAKNTGTLRFYDMCNCYHIENYHSSTSYHPVVQHTFPPWKHHGLLDGPLVTLPCLSRKRVTSGHSLCVQRRKIMDTINYMNSESVANDPLADHG